MTIAWSRRPDEPIASVRADWGGFVMQHAAGVPAHRLLPRICWAVTTIPIALRRHTDAEGNTALHIEGMEPWSRLWWERVARTFTLCSGELGDLVALPQDDVSLFEREVVVDHGAWAHDLLESPYRSSPATACRCGTRYVFATPKCPKCKGEDPIGVLLRDHGEDVDVATAQEIRNTVRGPGSDELEPLRSVLGSVVARAGQPLAAAGSHDALLEALDMHYQRRLSLPLLDPADLRALDTRPTRTACTVVQQIAEVSAAIRLASLGHESPPAWLPSFDVTERWEKRMHDTWYAARVALSHFAERQIASVLAFVPVRELLIEARRPGPRGVNPDGPEAGDALRSVVAKKDHRVVDAFLETLEGRDVLARAALTALDASIARENRLREEACGATERYVRWQLASDYATSPPDRQLEIARRLASWSDVAWKQTVKSRQPPPKHRPKARRAQPKFAGYPVWMWVTALIVLEVIMLALMLYKIGGIPI